MSRSVQKVSTLVRADFTVYDSLNNKVTGLVNADFGKFLSVDGVASGVIVTVTEVNAGTRPGEYTATFTPPTTGVWYLLINNAANNPRGWDEDFDVTVTGPDLGVFVVDGYTYNQIMELLGAALAGKISGAPLNPVFKSMDNLATRITAVCDASGNRTSVTLTP
jgi:hypothetical protein